jgi:hypothetical protein
VEAATVPQQPPPGQAQQPPDQHTLFTALTVILLSGMTVDAMTAAAAPLMAPLGVTATALKLALGLTLLNRPSATAGIPTGPATLQVWATEPVRRAAYLLSAAQRLEANPDLAAERVNLGRHLDAAKARTVAASRVDVAARSFGTELGWYSVRDSVTTPECRVAHGSNFQAARAPMIGYPGTPHGGTCRCLPGPPFKDARSVDQATRGVLGEPHNH